MWTEGICKWGQSKEYFSFAKSKEPGKMEAWQISAIHTSQKAFQKNKITIHWIHLIAT